MQLHMYTKKRKKYFIQIIKNQWRDIKIGLALLTVFLDGCIQYETSALFKS